MNFELPRLISFPDFGSQDLGYLSICENFIHCPFAIKRVFWTYGVPDGVVRGHHAHYYNEMILLAIAGRIVVETEMPDGTSNTFTLQRPDEGLYIPKYCWHTMEYRNNAIQLVLANSLHDAEDYIRSLDDFRNMIANNGFRV